MRRRRFKFDDLISGSTASALRALGCTAQPQAAASNALIALFPAIASTPCIFSHLFYNIPPPPMSSCQTSRVSGAAEFHRRALSEPDVSLSAHPAPSIRLLLEALEFAARPFPQMEVDAAQTVVQRRLVEVSVVVDPTTDVGVDQPSQIIKGQVGPVLKTPSPDFLTHCLERFLGRRRQERDAICSLRPFRKPRSKCVSEEVELDRGIASLAVGIRAVDNFCLLRVKHQPTCREALRKSDAQSFGLEFCPAVADRVIRIPFKGNGRMGPCHPQVERVMQKQIRQDWTYYSTNAKDNLASGRLRKGKSPSAAAHWEQGRFAE